MYYTYIHVLPPTSASIHGDTFEFSKHVGSIAHADIPLNKRGKGIEHKNARIRNIYVLCVYLPI